MKLQDERREYQYGRLVREALQDSPLDQFGQWMDQALAAGIQDPTAMTLATVSPEGKPWIRVLLLKGFDADGFYFYTSHKSRKAKEMRSNAQVALHFSWLKMDRQVIIGGKACPLPAETAEAYFATRPRESQIAAWVAEQSSPLESRAALDSAFAEANNRFAEGEVPMPEDWGGYHVKPDSFEFWQGGIHRLHDRFVYQADEQGNWNITQLAP